MKMLKIMSAGPTQVRENVRQARSRICTNPDLDPAFFQSYEETCKKISSILHTNNDTHILSGEGILGLEAAIASLTEPNDRALVIENGIFGEGFADFIQMYQGDVTFFHGDKLKGIDLDELKAFLDKDHDFAYATLVHVDTPSGVCNDITAICTLLHSYGILSVVDSVAGMIGEEVNVDEAHIDILCGGSQKAISVPPGLTIVTISDDAWRKMEQRKTPIAGFYVNLLNFKNVLKEQWFPYTMPVSDIEGLRVAIDNILDEPAIVNRHERIAKATREAVTKAGLTLYLNDNHANTVTVINVPEGVSSPQLLQDMVDDHHILISGCFSYLQDKVIRIGHMGENANVEDVALTLSALQACFTKQGYHLSCDMENVFLSSVRQG